MRLISAVRACFHGIPFRYLGLTIGIYILLDVAYHLFHGYQLIPALALIPHRWPVYLLMAAVYIAVSKIKQSNSARR